VGPATGPAKAAVSRSGSLIYLSGSSPSMIVVVDSLGARRPLDPKASYFSFPRFSPDGRRVALSTRDERSARGSIWIYTIASGTLQQLTTAGTVNDRPEWTPDGQRVVFRSDRSSPANKRETAIWWQRADGSDTARLLFRVAGANVNEAVISPDGRTLLARVADRQMLHSFWVRGVTGDTTPHMILPGTSGMGQRISPDGRWVAYASGLSGPMQVYVSPLTGDPARYQVSTDGGVSPVWSADGRRLMYAAGRQIIEATLSFKPSLEIVARRTLLDGNFDYVDAHASFDVSPDGKSLLVSQSQSTNARLILVHEWREELSALVRAAQR
jgi:dipeptidyl aminopeptidase/acylaminoacyl peptidase